MPRNRFCNDKLWILGLDLGDCAHSTKNGTCEQRISQTVPRPVLECAPEAQAEAIVTFFLNQSHIFQCSFRTTFIDVLLRHKLKRLRDLLFDRRHQLTHYLFQRNVLDRAHVARWAQLERCPSCPEALGHPQSDSRSVLECVPAVGPRFPR